MVKGFLLSPLRYTRFCTPAGHPLAAFCHELRGAPDLHLLCKKNSLMQ